MEKLLSVAEKEDSILSIYSYEIDTKKTIPVIVVNSFTSELSDTLKKLGQKGCIVLSDHDLQHGHDVYSITLLHIQARANHVFGEDLINELHIDPKEMRPHLEGTIRHVLIDIRESSIVGQNLTDLAGRLRIQCDRIWNACSYYNSQSFYGVDEMKEFLGVLNRERGVDQDEIYSLVFENGKHKQSLQQIHDQFHELVHYVDGLE